MDWSHYLIETGAETQKVRDYLIASQSVGPTAKARALIDAEQHALAAIAALRMLLGTIRDQQTPRGWDG